MRDIHILKKLTSEPWLMTPAMHRTCLDLALKHAERKAMEDDGDSQDSQDAIDLLVAPPISERIGEIMKINVVGIIGQHLSLMEKLCGAVDCIEIGNEITKALADESVKGILLCLDSPGGMVVGTPELASIVKQAAAVKPLVAFTDSEMCSAAYWIACGAEEIFASQSAVVGSIGAYMMWLDSSEAYKMNGFKMQVFADGKYKAAGVDGTTLTDEQKTDWQKGVDAISNKFKETVLASRKVEPETMQGQCFYGFEAVENGLIDSNKSLDEVITYLGELIQLAG